MSETSTDITPTRIYRPGEPISTGRQRIYDTYNTRDVPIGGNDSGLPGGSGSKPPQIGPRPSRTQRMETRFRNVPGGNRTVQVPPGIPRVFGNPGVILVSWIAAMALVSWDEWNSHHILPRPARLWYTSLTYMLLALVSTIDVMVPLTSALAVGFTVALTIQYYTNTGSFTKPASKNPQVGSPTTSTNTGTGTVPVVNPTGTSGAGANPTGPGKTGGGAPGVPAA